jgi:DNA-binding transcriptional MerR regulator
MYRIGELARRTGTSVDLLRAWERRYGLLRPARTAGGFRLYGDDDAARVERMRSGLAHGLAAAEAARAAIVEPERSDELLPALLAFDGERANDVLDKLFSRLSVEGVLREAIQPALREIGDRWARGEVSVAQEHFASHLLRGRLLALASRWDQGVGPRALLACAPGDLHDLPLVVFGLALRERGWRILFLGADTPLEVVAATAATESPDLVVLASSRLHEPAPVAELATIAAGSRLALAGRWPLLDVPAVRLEGDAVDLAASLDASVKRAYRVEEAAG